MHLQIYLALHSNWIKLAYWSTSTVTVKSVNFGSFRHIFQNSSLTSEENCRQKRHKTSTKLKKFFVYFSRALKTHQNPEIIHRKKIFKIQTVKKLCRLYIVEHIRLFLYTPISFNAN